MSLNQCIGVILGLSCAAFSVWLNITSRPKRYDPGMSQERKPIISRPVWDFILGCFVGLMIYGLNGGGLGGMFFGGVLGGVICMTLGIIAAFGKKRRERKP